MNELIKMRFSLYILHLPCSTQDDDDECCQQNCFIQEFDFSCVLSLELF